jgi:hypothetical protein
MAGNFQSIRLILSMSKKTVLTKGVEENGIQTQNYPA